MVRYSFLVGLFHSQLHAGFIPAHRQPTSLRFFDAAGKLCAKTGFGIMCWETRNGSDQITGIPCGPKKEAEGGSDFGDSVLKG